MDGIEYLVTKAHLTLIRVPKGKIMGRPAIFKKEIASKICERLAAGESLRSICRDEEMPGRTTVNKWIIEDTEGFANQYARAKDIGIDELADEIIEIADRDRICEKKTTKANGDVETVVLDQVERSKLMVDSRKWYLSKIAPKRYGDKLQLAGDKDAPLVLSLTKTDADL
jgi:hypothetical protein